MLAEEREHHSVEVLGLVEVRDVPCALDHREPGPRNAAREALGAGGRIDRVLVARHHQRWRGDPLDRRACLAKLERMAKTVRESGLEHKVIVATCERERRRRR